ncbi:helix-turn-helix domain-containing protein [Streptomyces sp. OE57]
MKRRYDAGVSNRELAELTGRSYGYFQPWPTNWNLPGTGG